MVRKWYVYEDLGDGMLREWVFEAGIIRTLARKVKEAGIPPEKIKIVLSTPLRIEAKIITRWLKLYLKEEI